MEENRQKNSKRRLNSLILLVAFTAIMLIVSTYAWFSTQKNVTLANLTGTVKVAEGLQISLDAENWSNSIDFSQYSDQNDLKQLYGGVDHNLIPTEMLPVSTTANENLDATGTGTGIKELSFYRGTNVNKNNLYGIQAVSNDLTKLDSDAEDQITSASNPDTYPGYYAIDFFLENSSAATSGTDILQLNSDSSVSVKTGGNNTVGLQNTPRVAFALYNSDVSDSANQSVTVGATNQAKILAATTGTKSTIKDVAIWEPNANAHDTYIVTNNNYEVDNDGNPTNLRLATADETAYLSAPATHKFTTTDRIPTFAINSSALTLATETIKNGSTTLGTGYSNLYDWSGTYASKGLEKQITLQTNSTSGSVQNLLSVTTPESTVQPTASGTPVTFNIPKAQVCRVRMYIWLEGQDVDCINYASHGGGIEVDVGLIKDAAVGSGS